MPKIILKINKTSDEIYRDENICCYVLDSALPEDYIKSFPADGRILLLSGEKAAELCGQVGVAGIVAEISSDYPIKAQVAKIRQTLGNSKVLGTVINTRRHEAMLVSETEPDFVTFKFSADEFEAAAGIIKWYNELFLIQSAVDLTAGIQNIASLEPDFVIINSRDYKDFGC